MNLVRAALAAVVVTALTVAAILAVRRRAPERSYFNDVDRAGGVFGVLATGFTLLPGFFDNPHGVRLPGPRRPADVDRHVPISLAI